MADEPAPPAAEPQPAPAAAEPDPAPPPALDREAPAARPEPGRTRGAVLLGLVFVAVGGVFLLEAVWPGAVGWRYAWPVALIAAGLLILARARGT